MSTYTAVLGDARSVGSKLFSAVQNGGGSDFNRRLNPQLASCRIRTVIAPHIVSDSVGGFISADFTIPPEEAQLWRPCIRYGVVVWLFDGSTPIFWGYAEQPTWNADGSVFMNVSGLWTVLSKSRMREAWDLWDISQWQKGQGAVDNKAGSVNQNSNGSITLSFPGGSTLGINDRCSADYFLFGEPVGTYDQKLITAFEFNMADSANLGTNFRFRVYGKTTAAGTGGDLLWDSAGGVGASGVQGALNLAGTNQGASAWISTSGYRCIRVEIRTLIARTPLAVDTYVTLDRIRVGTRESLFVDPSTTVDTAAIARDIFAAQASEASFTLLDSISPEFWVTALRTATPDGNSFLYNYGLDPITGTGTAANTGNGITGFNALEWQAPTDVLSELAALDGSHVGFYLPYNGRGGYDAPGGAVANGIDVGSWWITAPPQLVYQQFPDPNYSPDYTVQTREGAVVDETTDIQPLLSTGYVNYNTKRGIQQSVVTVDTNTQNYLYAQGYRRAEDWTLQPSVGNDQQATRLAQQTLKQRRQPYTSATITINGDGSQRYPILKQGAVIPKLATIRPGSVRIVDIPAASGLRAGYATQVEWWGQTLTDPEKVQITLGQPGQHAKTRRIGRIVHGDLHIPRRRRLLL